jgi:hypothetical protein
MTSEVIDLDLSRLRLCIEILPEVEAEPERLVIISICRDFGSPLIRTIALSELTPIPSPLAEIIQDYADSALALPIQPDDSTSENHNFAGFPKQTTPSFKPQQQALAI